MEVEPFSRSSGRKTSRQIFAILVIPSILFATLFLSLAIPRLGFLISITDTEYLGLPEVRADNVGQMFTDPIFEPWYRPLDAIIVSLEQGAFRDDFAPMILIQATIPAFTSVTLYFLALELSKGNRFVAIGASLLYPLTLGVIETTWLFMHKVILSDLLVILGMLCYVRYTRSANFKWLLPLWACGFVAPWIRELGGVLAAVVLITTIIERRKDIKLLASAAILVFHALYSSFFPMLFLEQRIELISIFDRAREGLFSSSVFSGSIGILNLDNPFRVALFYSPFLTIGLFAGIAIFLFAKKGTLYRLGGISVLIILALSLAMMYFPSASSSPVIPFLFVAAIAIPSLKFGKLLPIWFAVPIISFIFLPVHTAWLKMAAVPFIIMALIWIQQIPSLKASKTAEMKQDRVSSKIQRYNFAVLPFSSNLTVIPVIIFAVLLIFSVPNLINAESTFRNNIETEQEIGEWAANNMVEGSALISNLRQNWDFEYYSNSHITAYLLDFKLKDPLPGGRGTTINELSNKLGALSEEHPAYYFITAERFGTPGFPSLVEDDLEKVSSFYTECSYPIFDPLQLVLPDKYWGFGGPTDLKHEYNVKRGLFQGGCDATFEIYRYTGSSSDLKKQIDQMEPQFASNHPVLWEDGYKGYQISGYRGNFYAIPYGEGSFDIKRFDNREYSVQFSASSSSELKEILDKNTLFAELVEEGDYGYNIMVYRGKYYAIPQGEGAFELERFNSGGYSSGYVDDSLERLRSLVQTRTLVLIETFQGYNLFGYNGKYYAIPISEGTDVDIDKLGSVSITEGPGFTANSIEDLRAKIMLPHFIKNHGDYSIIFYKDRYYAISQSDGEFDPVRVHNNEYSELYIGSTISEVEQLIGDSDKVRIKWN